MRKYIKLVVILFTLASMTAWAGVKSKEEISNEAKAKAPHISSQQLSDSLSEKQNLVLVDIRTEDEYEAGHIQGAQWLPRGTLEFSIQNLVKDPDTRIVLYCNSGGRSALATLTLEDMGYTNVVDLDGGFKAWVAEGNTFYNLHGELKVVNFNKQE